MQITNRTCTTIPVAVQKKLEFNLNNELKSKLQKSILFKFRLHNLVHH